MKSDLSRVSGGLALLLLAAAAPAAADRDVLVVTSTNAASANNVLVFKLNTSGAPSLTLLNMPATGGTGGASTNAGAVQFEDETGAVVNYGSNTITQLRRNGDFINIGKTIELASNCMHPISVALSGNHAFVVGANCAESRDWPSGNSDGTIVTLSDSSAAQIAAGETWAAVTLTSGKVLQLPLNAHGALAGTSSSVTLPSGANSVPLGAAFWGDLLGFLPAHSPGSFALVNKQKQVFPVVGPQPAYPTNAPCWLAKGPGNVWYAGNSPAMAISIFFSDGQGGAFYKSVSLPGVATDITVSQDQKWLAVIYSAADGGHVAVYSIDTYGDLTQVAISGPVSAGVSAFNGVAFSQ